VLVIKAEYGCCLHGSEGINVQVAHYTNLTVHITEFGFTIIFTDDVPMLLMFVSLMNILKVKIKLIS